MHARRGGKSNSSSRDSSSDSNSRKGGYRTRTQRFCAMAALLCFAIPSLRRCGPSIFSDGHLAVVVVEGFKGRPVPKYRVAVAGNDIRLLESTPWTHIHLMAPRMSIRLFSSSTSSSSSSSSCSSSASSSTSASQSQGTTQRSQSFENFRSVLLHKHLIETGRTDADLIAHAAWTNLQDPLRGYDPRFGRPAIRTYRAFVLKPDNDDDNNEDHDKKNGSNNVHNDNDDNDDDDDKNNNNNDNTNDDTVSSKRRLEDMRLEAEAGRCARQIDFLIKRHLSHETEWIRHHDPQSLQQIGNTSTSTTRTTTITSGATVSPTTITKTTTTTTTTTFPMTLVLDNLRSAMNVGSLFRTAEACGCRQVLTCGITPHPTGSGAEKLAKAALGAERLVPTLHFSTTREALVYLQQRNVTVLALETTERSQSYSNLDYRLYYNGDHEDLPSNNNNTDLGGVALVLGNEVTGVDTELLEDVDEIIELPTFGIKNSLNVASCAPVVLYEILRQWRT